MKLTMPVSVEPASSIDSFAASDWLCVGSAEKPEPGLTRLAAVRPSVSAMIVATKK